MRRPGSLPSHLPLLSLPATPPPPHIMRPLLSSKLFPVALLLSASLSPLLAQNAGTPPGTQPETPKASPASPTPPAFLPIAPRVELKDGDTFVFLGDSITHSCLYTQYVEDYFYTRYPERRIHFHNAGVSGDRASNALDRFEQDVAAYRPKAVSILLGMNDGRYLPFDQAIFDTYQAGMSALLDKIAALGATAIPMTPTMHDARAARLGPKPSEPRDTYYNGVLALFGAWLREMAQQRGLGFVDMYAPLNQITLEQRRADPNWTMIKDAVHPGPGGHVVMAAAMISETFPKSQVGSVTVGQVDGKWMATAANGKVSEVTPPTPTDPLSFTLTLQALPWVLPADAAEGVKLTHLGHRLSNEKLTIRHLPPGKYEVRIDGKPIGQWNDTQLSAGIEIGENSATPQYQQALQVAELNKRRNTEAYKPLRNEFSQLKGQRKKLSELEGKPESEAAKVEFSKWHAAMTERVQALQTKAKEFEDEIYRINQPQPHKYEILPTPPKP